MFGQIYQAENISRDYSNWLVSNVLQSVSFSQLSSPAKRKRKHVILTIRPDGSASTQVNLRCAGTTDTVTVAAAKQQSYVLEDP